MTTADADAAATGADVEVSYNGIYHQRTNRLDVVYLAVCLLNALIASAESLPAFVDAYGSDCVLYTDLVCIFSPRLSEQQNHFF